MGQECDRYYNKLATFVFALAWYTTQSTYNYAYMKKCIMYALHGRLAGKGYFLFGELRNE